MQLPSVKQMQYLVAVNETQHFGKAADACFVTQSALSTGIRELENLLGVKLFERSRKQISTTPVGEEIGRQAKHCLQEIGVMIEMAERNNKPLSGPVRLGIIPTIAPFMLPGLLPVLRSEFAEMDFFLSEDLTAGLYEHLQNGDLDLLLVALPYSMPDTEQRVLFKDPLMLAFHGDTRHIDPETWEPREASLDMLMLLEEGHCLRDHALDKIMPNKKRNINPFNASSLSTLIHMIGSDLGFSLLPQMAIDSPVVQNSGIKLRSLGTESSREIAMVWRKGSARSEDFRVVADTVAANH